MVLNFMRRLLVFSFLLLLVGAVLFAWQVAVNNTVIPPLTRADIRPVFEKVTGWLDSNYPVVEQNSNRILWWMVGQAAQASHDPALLRIYADYVRNHEQDRQPDVWTALFREYYRPGAGAPDILMLGHMPPYQQFFIYSLGCDRNLETEPSIQAQMRPGFCDLHYLYPRCVTHQLMGLRFMQRQHCGHDDIVAGTIAELQRTVQSELFWDFRVGDAYIQRVAMLVDTGALDAVKPVWVRRILDAQNSDGSWDDLYPLLPLPDGRSFGLTSTRPAIGDGSAHFHTTAQAIWLLGMLLEQLPE